MANGKFQDIILKPVLQIGEQLLKSNFSAYLVGGCVRDLLLGRRVKDWDVATSARPEEITKIFPDSFYNNKFGTVGVKIDSGVAEITTFREESRYSDSRHPDEVVFAKTIFEDLERRDFTVNALAIDFQDLVETQNFASLLKKIRHGRETITFEESLSKDTENRGPGIEGKKKNLATIKEIPRLGFGEYPKFFVLKVGFFDLDKLTGRNIIVDKFSGLADLEKRVIRAVGDPKERFQEDALRLLRVVRFAVELGFKIEKNTALAVENNAGLLRNISRERIRDELSKILLSDWPAEGVALLRKLGLLGEIIPVLTEGIGVKQNWHHIYSVFRHSVLSLKFCFSDELEIRLAALLHDIAKPRVKGLGKEGQATFYNHEIVGERITRKMLSRLCFPSTVVDETSKLVRYHMFNYDPAMHSESTVRRLLHRVGGIKRMEKLLILRVADRLGSGCKQGEVYKLRKLKYLIDKVSQDPISLKQLKVNGADIMRYLGIKPGPQIGSILDILLTVIIAEPKKNTKEELLKLAEGLWLAEKSSPGFLAKEKRGAEEFLEGKKKNHDIKLQEKHKVREK